MGPHHLRRSTSCRFAYEKHMPTKDVCHKLVSFLYCSVDEKNKLLDEYHRAKDMKRVKGMEDEIPIYNTPKSHHKNPSNSNVHFSSTSCGKLSKTVCLDIGLDANLIDKKLFKKFGYMKSTSKSKNYHNW